MSDDTEGSQERQSKSATYAGHFKLHLIVHLIVSNFGNLSAIKVLIISANFVKLNKFNFINLNSQQQEAWADCFSWIHEYGFAIFIQIRLSSYNHMDTHLH